MRGVLIDLIGKGYGRLRKIRSGEVEIRQQRTLLHNILCI